MKITLGNQSYKVLDTKEKVTIADSFVVRQNKIYDGNGEAKLYIGQDNAETRGFFGGEGFYVSCFLMKKDLLKYLEETKEEYLHPQQPYKNKLELPSYWLERKLKIDALPEKIEFEVIEQTQLIGSRVYVNSVIERDKNYNIIRELSLPNITYISIVKLEGSDHEISYYFRLFADYFGEVEHPYLVEQESKQIEKEVDSIEKNRLSRARMGQGEYRKKLLELCPVCPITLVTDDRLLIASHIKPWASSTDFEKTDPMNGFMFTPTFDYLFDRGFLSFSDDKKSILSPFLSNMTYSRLGISDNKTFPFLAVEGRENYLDYHRTQILKR